MREIDVRTAHQWMLNGDAEIIDVREAGEYAAIHIPGVKHVPLGGIAAAGLQPDGSKKLLFICAAGGRSMRACGMVSARAGQVYSVAGGMGAWKNAGLPTEGKGGFALTPRVLVIALIIVALYLILKGFIR
ncbi:MAG: sulfurtransferase [Rhizobiales bacterium PAR1]|nr:MAG: sulfurtransferase [Rhizobiales bacterium PAR1]